MKNSLYVYPKNYLDAFKNGAVLKIGLKKFTFEALSEIYPIVNELLEAKNLSKYTSFLHVAIREMVQNAIKATQKRIFFIRNNLDIIQDHAEGTEKFKQAIANEETKTIELNDYAKFTAEILFGVRHGHFVMVVKNYGQMTKQEIKSVEHMIERGRINDQISDLLGDEVRQREGGGLGLSMIIVLMKNLEIPTDNLFFTLKGGYTHFCLKVPITE